MHQIDSKIAPVSQPSLMNARSSSLNVAKVFGSKKSNAQLLFKTQNKFHIQDQPYPEILFTGRANVGKSLLLNSVMARSEDNALVLSSRSPGKTKSLDFFCVGYKAQRLVLVDSPGYGARGRPEWGALWEWYIENRVDLHRVYILINSGHGVTSSDEQVLEYLHEKSANRPAKAPFSIQAVLTKIDELPSQGGREKIDNIIKDIHKAAPACLAPILTSGKKPQLGIEQLRASIVQGANLR